MWKSHCTFIRLLICSASEWTLLNIFFIPAQDWIYLKLDKELLWQRVCEKLWVRVRWNLSQWKSIVRVRSHGCSCWYMLCCLWVTTGLTCVSFLHSIAAEALIKQYQTCPSKTMGDFTCLSFLAANFPCSSFFWKSTPLGAIFLTSLRAVVIIFNKPLSEASLLHLRLLFASSLLPWALKTNQEHKSSGSPIPGAAKLCMHEKKNSHCK